MRTSSAPQALSESTISNDNGISKKEARDARGTSRAELLKMTSIAELCLSPSKSAQGLPQAEPAPVNSSLKNLAFEPQPFRPTLSAMESKAPTQRLDKPQLRLPGIHHITGATVAPDFQQEYTQTHNLPGSPYSSLVDSGGNLSVRSSDSIASSSFNPVLIEEVRSRLQTDMQRIMQSVQMSLKLFAAGSPSSAERTCVKAMSCLADVKSLVDNIVRDWSQYTYGKYCRISFFYFREEHQLTLSFAAIVNEDAPAKFFSHPLERTYSLPTQSLGIHAASWMGLKKRGK